MKNICIRISRLLTGEKIFGICMFFVCCFFLRIRPDVIVSTGANTAVPMCYIAKIFGRKVIFIETFASSKKKTLSGILLYPIANAFFVQWESMLNLYPKAIYKGALY